MKAEFDYQRGIIIEELMQLENKLRNVIFSESLNLAHIRFKLTC